MKKNKYGNIEDIVVSIKIVTSQGTYMRESEWPRQSCGPDINQIILGSEGNIGIITEAVIRLRPVPEFVKYGSIIFPDYDTGVLFMDEVAKSRNWPASMRFVDNIQF